MARLPPPPQSLHEVSLKHSMEMDQKLLRRNAETTGWTEGRQQTTVFSLLRIGILLVVSISAIFLYRDVGELWLRSKPAFDLSTSQRVDKILRQTPLIGRPLPSMSESLETKAPTV